MASSPSSEKTLYFDVPSEPAMSSETPVQPVDAPVAPAADATQGSSSKPPPAAEHPTTNGVVTDEKVTDKPALERNESSGWLPATDAPPADATKAAAVAGQTNGHARAASASVSPRRSGSLSRRTTFTNADGQTITGSTFIGGAATTGPNSTAEPNAELHQRSVSADASLTAKQRAKIAKEEAKNDKRLSKVIKEEAKAEKKALSLAIDELAELQKLQKTAVKTEAKAQAKHTKVLAEYQKIESVFLAARTKFEAAQARLNSEEETLGIVRNNAKEATERLQEKAQEVDSLRTMYGVDERERAAKLSEISAKVAENKTGWFSR